MNIGTRVPSLLLYHTYTCSSASRLGIHIAGMTNLLSREVIRVQARNECRTVDAPPLLLRSIEVVPRNNTGRREPRQGREEPRLFTTAANGRRPDEVRGHTMEPLSSRELVDVNLVYDLLIGRVSHPSMNATQFHVRSACKPPQHGHRL